MGFIKTRPILIGMSLKKLAEIRKGAAPTIDFAKNKKGGNPIRIEMNPTEGLPESRKDHGDPHIHATNQDGLTSKIFLDGRVKHIGKGLPTGDVKQTLIWTESNKDEFAEKWEKQDFTTKIKGKSWIKKK